MKKITIKIIVAIIIFLATYFLARFLVNNYYLKIPAEVKNAQQETSQLQEEAQRLLDSKSIDK